jgi:hypothetical protein
MFQWSKPTNDCDAEGRLACHQDRQPHKAARSPEIDPSRDSPNETKTKTEQAFSASFASCSAT